MVSLTFDEILSKVKGKTLLTEEKLYFIYQSALQTKEVIGDIAEVGVFRGGSAFLIHEVLPSKDLYLFDTFTGIPERTQIDKHEKGDFSDTSPEVVKALIPAATILIGKFPETAIVLSNNIYSFVHIDADQYQTTVEAIKYFDSKMAKDGIIVFDDYGWYNCPGVKKAVDAFYGDRIETHPNKMVSQCRINY